MSIQQQIAGWADKLRDISATGSKFTKNVYDKENYEKIQNIVGEMLTFDPFRKNTDIKSIPLPYLTRPGPLIGGDGAIINSEEEILLIQRADNRMWAMPGGLLEVGETPAEGVLREIFEETGITCQITKLIGIYDSRLCGTSSPFHIYHLLFLCTPLMRNPITIPSHKREIISYKWFKEAFLPESIDPGHITRIPEAFRTWKGEKEAYFD
ncbi:MAG: NUDIX domain-containing protein [Candidatus Heimdallarchaeota archaeon]|nr:NUDIX domain-containing protein [Candidatus Heimdallarchaeota archaeon]